MGNIVCIRKILKALLVAPLLILAVTIVGCSQGAGSKVADKLELAVKYLAESKFEEAILAYQEAIEIDKKCVKAYQYKRYTKSDPLWGVVIT